MITTFGREKSNTNTFGGIDLISGTFWSLVRSTKQHVIHVVEALHLHKRVSSKFFF